MTGDRDTALCRGRGGNRQIFKSAAVVALGRNLNSLIPGLSLLPWVLRGAWHRSFCNLFPCTGLTDDSGLVIGLWHQ